ncbi:MAG: hypothetical protein L3K14_03455 [Thermoplasmata archaeon]|nr:hypothetical protein [Thermoplasmata archaeon]
MDVPLYALALAIFAILYLAIGVFLGFTLIIALVLLFAYLALRYGNLAENYPHSAPDSMITVIFIGITWAIFTYLGSKNPVPFVGNGLTYTPGTALPLPALIAISLVVAVAFLAIGSFLGRDVLAGGPVGGTRGETGGTPPTGVR